MQVSTTRNVVGGRGRWDLPQAAVDWICGGLQYQVARTHTMVWQSGDVSHNPDLASYLEAGGNLKAECVLVRPGGQVEHHLFPQVPRHRLAAVHAEVVRFCRDEGVAFHEAGVVDGTFEASPAPSAMAPVARARGGGKQAAESTRRGAGGRVRSYIGGGDMMRGDGSRGGGGGGGRFCGTCRRWRSSSSATSRASSPRRASRWHSTRPPHPRILCRACA